MTGFPYVEEERPKRRMMTGIWPKKAGEDTVAWRDACSWCGQEGPEHPYATCFEEAEQSDGTEG